MENAEPIDVELRCQVCGTEYSAVAVTPSVNQGIMLTWSDLHKHTTEELVIYHDHAVQAERIRWESHTHDDPAS